MTKSLLKKLSPFLPALLALPALLHAPEAQAKFTFAHNHPDLDWYSIESEHFVVHYPQSKKQEGNEHYHNSEVSARMASRVAEQMWEPICKKYNYYLKERVHIVVLNQSDDLEGFTVPPWDWIEISTNPGSYFYRTRGRMEWMSDVLVHEFSHVVSLKNQGTMSEGTMYSSVGGLYNDGIHKMASAAEVPLQDTDPWWWVEGTAEYSSDEGAYNWWTPSRDLTVRSSWLDDRLLPLDEVYTVNQPHSWQDGERGYQQGYSFGQYLRQRFGELTYMKFADAYASRWKSNWNNTLEDVLGVSADQLWNDWLEYIGRTYKAQYDAVKAEGEVSGRELLSAKAEWDFSTPSGRDAWMGKKWWEREKARDKTGQWVAEARYDAASQMVGISNRGNIVIEKYPVDREEAISGFYRANANLADQSSRMNVGMPANFMYGWDFFPGGKQIVVTGYEHLLPNSVFEGLTRTRLETDGYNWNQLWIYDLETRTEKKKGREFETLEPEKTLGVERFKARPIPNTLRACDPAISPDGKKIAFFQYEDGTLNLATINVDGSDKKLLTDYHDNTWMQRVDWSPDGKQLVFALFHNFQQNLYVVNADGTDLHAITWDAAEEMDAHWATDGRIYFSAEPKGINNVYSYDPKTKEISQITNVITAAESPWITEEGNLIYTHYTSFGFKPYGLAKEDFFNKVVTDDFNVSPDAAVVAKDLAYQEDLSSYAAQTRPYRPIRTPMPIAGVPLLRFDNDSTTNFGLAGGGAFFFQDYVEFHSLDGAALLGEDPYAYIGYTYQGWYPNFRFMYLHATVKFDSGYLLDYDDNPETTHDIGTYDSKRRQYYDYWGAYVDYPWNETVRTALAFDAYEIGFTGNEDANPVPFVRYFETGPILGWSDYSIYAETTVNPAAGRSVELKLTHGFYDVVYEAYGGATVDDGELLSSDQFNKVELRWTEQINIPTLGGIGFLERAREKDHRIQLDMQAGAVDRNVFNWMEFQAGGQHPYNWGASSIRPNTMFAGYPMSALSGETMAIANLAYRFPIVNNGEWRLGPFYFYKPMFQIMGTAGNLWSYRPPEESDVGSYYYNDYDERVAYDPSAIRREIPFVDKAYKNDNRMLYDAGVELHIPATMWNFDWDSFVRVAYGFQTIRGYYDPNGDDITDTSEETQGDSLSNEREPGSVRVYIGLGTGW